MFWLMNGRHCTPVETSQPMLRDGGDWLRSTARTSVLWNCRYETLQIRRSCGVTSKSAPPPTSASPGLTKFDWPSSLEERRLASTPFLPESATPPPPTSGTACLIQKLESA